jgi:hypothetical protein
MASKNPSTSVKPNIRGMFAPLSFSSVRPAAFCQDFPKVFGLYQIKPTINEASK